MEKLMPSLATAKEVAAALVQLGLPAPSTAALAAIAQVCRDDFLTSLRTCLSGADTTGAARVQIERVLGCTSEATISAAVALNLPLSLADAVRAARVAPVRFLSALQVAAQVNHPRAAEARAWLGTLVAMPATNEAPARGAAAAPPVAAPPVAAPPKVPGEAANRGDRRDYLSAHVYGGSSALCFNAVDGSSGRPGVMVDAAVRDSGGTIQWCSATHVMLDESEVAAVYAVFRGRRPSVQFSNHGRQHDKSFSLERQDGGYFCKVSSRRNGDAGGVRAVKIPDAEAVAVAALFGTQLFAAYPRLPQAEVIELVLSVHTRPADAAEARA